MAATAQSDGLVRWLLGGLVAGGIVLGLLVAAYEIGYHHGRSHARTVSPSAAPAATTTTLATASPAAQGARLFAADSCSSCHSLDGTRGVGPTIKGLAGSKVVLSDGRTVTADDAYLARSITTPDAEIVKGYQKGIMSAAVASFGLNGKPQDVDALVAFIKSHP
jgi:cytochrome c2